MSSTYKIDIELSREAVTRLTSGPSPFYLYGFKGVTTAANGGQPLVWFSSSEIAQQMTLTWEEQYGVFNSETEIKNGTQIAATNHSKADLGDIAVIQPKSHLFDVSGGGTPGLIEVDNNASISLTVGLTQEVTGHETQLCAFPAINGESIDMTPIETVVLFFAQESHSTGTVIEQASMPGIQIDLTGAPKQTRTVKYNKNNWLDNNETWVEQIPSGAVLRTYLINPND